MSRSAWLACLALALPAGALAEGKCGDAPYPMPNGKLVVTWVLPVPGNATVAQVSSSEFQSAGGDHKHPNLPTKYGNPPQTPPQSTALGGNFILATSVQVLQQWESQYNIPMTPESQSVLQLYVDGGFKLHGVLVEHPALGKKDDPKTFDLCTCVNQRGILYHDGNQETLYVRSWFHSAQSRSPNHSKNFVPDAGLKVTFARPTIWFPLRFAQVAQEQNTYLVLDVLTQNPIPLAWIPPTLTATGLPDRVFAGRTWKVVQITGALPRGSAAPDLELPLR